MKKTPSTLELSWPAECQHTIFRELGSHYARHGRFRPAISNLTKATVANPLAVDCHYRKGLAQMRNSDLTTALESCRDGIALVNNEDHALDYACALLESRTLFELAEFEEHVKLTANRKEQFSGGHRRDELEAELRIAFRGYENALGTKAGHCLYGLRKNVERISKKLEAEDLGNRPTWKIRKDQGECDAVSLMELQAKEPHIRNAKHVEKSLNMLGQIHLNRSWKDLEFLRSLRKGGKWEKVVQIPQANESSKALSDVIEDCYKKVSTDLNKLQAGSPMYAYRNNRFGSTAKFEQFKQDEVFKYRYKTYRDVHNQLDHMHELRKTHKLSHLIIYAEDILWNYYQIKTDQVFPDRYKFVTEICNIVGLAIVDQLVIPIRLMDEPLLNRLHILLDLPLSHGNDIMVPVFGDKSTYRDPSALDYKYISYKNRLTALEKRIRFSRYPIERAFLYHELCRAHLQADKPDAARAMACRVMEEAAQAGSNLWYFLGVLTLVKADCVQRNVEKCAGSLEEAADAVVYLDDERLTHVVQVAHIINEMLLADKLKRESTVGGNR